MNLLFLYVHLFTFNLKKWIMKNKYLLISLFFGLLMHGQLLDSLHTITFKTVQNPNTLQNTDGIVRVSKFHPNFGVMNNIGTGTNTVGGNFTVDGGSVNQVNNTYNLVGSNSFMSFDINTGNFLGQTPINSFSNVGNTFFGMVRFNNSDATLYGLARVTTPGSSPSLYLARLNTTNGNLFQLSQNPIPFQAALSGSVIDPDQMIYYFTNSTKLIGLDLYNGNVYSSPDFVFNNSEYFGFANFAFDCSTSQIYGLILGRYLSPNSPFPNGYINYLRLGKVNPATGVVTEVSTTNLPPFGYSVAGGSTIDETNQIYYFVGNGLIIYGVSLQTGAVVSAVAPTFNDANNLFFISNQNNCINRVALRPNPSVLDTSTLDQNKLVVYPNPTSRTLFIDTSILVEKAEVYDANGRVVRIFNNQNQIDVSDLQSGIYFLRVFEQQNIRNWKFVKSSN